MACKVGCGACVRRDFTINSLFYNINTRAVEDFTGKGLEDLLEHRTIRTPLPAEDTFRDGMVILSYCNLSAGP
jgi:tRNA nucleotidyltransferase (CCA-adding enzyme)